MNLSSYFIYYTLLIGILSGINTFGFSMLKTNPIIALFWEFLAILIMQSVWIYSSKEPIFPTTLTKDSVWILLMAITAVIASYLMARAFQVHHFNPAVFSLSNTIIASIILVCIGYFFLHSSLNIYNFIGLILGISSIYLLSFK